MFSAMGRSVARLVVGGLIGLTASSAAAQCTDQWTASFGVPPGMNGNVRVATSFDPDGPGPKPPLLVAGGEFDHAGGVFASHFATWNGHVWTGYSTGVGGTVSSLTVWDPDGPGPQPELLIAGGNFTVVEGVAANRVASWNGSAWHSLSTGFAGTTVVSVNALTSWDPDGPGPLTPRLVAAGAFTTRGDGTPINHIAIWDGAAWQPLGAGLDSSVFALTTWDPDGPGPLTPRLIAAGGFATSGSTTLNQLAMWDGSAWQSIGGGLTGTVSTRRGIALTTWDPDGPGPTNSRLIVGGSFTGAGAISARDIASWDGSTWQALGTEIGDEVDALTSWDPDGPGPQNPVLIAAGQFTGDLLSLKNVALWDGSAWHALDAGVSTFAYALAQWDPDGAGPISAQLVLGGSFASSGTTWLNDIARWDGSVWKPLGSGLDGAVFAATTWDPDGSGPQATDLVAGGIFTIANGQTVNRIARWHDGAWLPMGTGVNQPVNALTTWDPDGGGPLPDELVAVGAFTTAGGVTVNRVARWNGTVWQAIGSPTPGVNGTINAVATWDQDGPGGAPAKLVVGGQFPSAGGTPVNNIAVWDGSSWQAMGSGTNGIVLALRSWSPTGLFGDTAVYVGGQFMQAGGLTGTSYIARWTTSGWDRLGQGLNSYAYAFAEWNAPSQVQLVVVGAFSIGSGSVPSKLAIRWNGSTWIRFDSALDSFPAYAVTVWDPDGIGPLTDTVMIGGTFTTSDFGATVVNHVARWDGDSWAPTGVGTDGPVFALTTWDPDGSGPLRPMPVMGGSFTKANGGPVPFLAGMVVQAPIILTQPQAPAGVSAGDDVAMLIDAVGTGTLDYRWRKDGADLIDGPTGSGSIITGAGTAAITIQNVGVADDGSYDVMVGNACGHSTSDPAVLSVSGGCAADLTSDGIVDFGDYLEFLNLFDAQDPAADLNGDGVIDFGDYLEFLNHYDAGC